MPCEPHPGLLRLRSLLVDVVFATTDPKDVTLEIRRAGWEEHGGQAKDGWPLERYNDLIEEAERRIEEEFKRLGREGQKLADAVAKMQHAPNGMPTQFIPQLD